MKAISTRNAPAAIGPYSQGICAEDFLFVSGQIPIDPETGELVPGDIKAQTQRALDNIEAILTDSKAGFENVVKVEVYLTDMADFSAMNDVYAARFIHEPRPARQTMQVAALPRGAKIEISCIACLASPN